MIFQSFVKEQKSQQMHGCLFKNYFGVPSLEQVAKVFQLSFFLGKFSLATVGSRFPSSSPNNIGSWPSESQSINL